MSATLSLTQCAEQFEFYANAFEPERQQHEARYEAHKDVYTDEAGKICIWESHQISLIEAKQHQLRFAARFLRENAAPQHAGEALAGALKWPTAQLRHLYQLLKDHQVTVEQATGYLPPVIERLEMAAEEHRRATT